jgi:hypothetical protein
VTRTIPAAAVRILRDALAEAAAAGITDPASAAQHAASALLAHGWHITAHPLRPQDGHPTR